MAKTTIIIGGLLIAVGVIAYVATGMESITAAIPAFVGLPIALLGLVAMNPKATKHAMHAAVILGLLGFLAAAGRLVPVLIKGGASGAAIATLGLMALLCGLFVVLCVRSFIAAGKARRAAAAESAAA